MTIRTDLQTKKRVMKLLKKLKTKYKINRSYLIYFAVQVTTYAPSSITDKIKKSLSDNRDKQALDATNDSSLLKKLHRNEYLHIRIPNSDESSKIFDEDFMQAIKDNLICVGSLFVLFNTSEQLLFSLLVLSVLLKEDTKVKKDLKIFRKKINRVPMAYAKRAHVALLGKY